MLFISQRKYPGYLLTISKMWRKAVLDHLRDVLYEGECRFWFLLCSIKITKVRISSKKLNRIAYLKE